MAVELRQQTQDDINRHVEGGRYATPDEVVAAGLQLLDARAAADTVRGKIAEGVAQLDRGEGQDGDAVFADLVAGLPTAADRAR